MMLIESCWQPSYQHRQQPICDIWVPTSYWDPQPGTISLGIELLSISVPQIYGWVHVHQVPSHRRLLQCTFSQSVNPCLLTTNRHSSSSAIFERDIEPVVPPSPPVTHHSLNPHRIPRSKGTEQLENSVPSVLDSAAAILAGQEDIDVGDQVAVVSPASPIFDKGRSSGFASPIGSFRSRSPSPLGVRMGATGHSRAEILLTLPSAPHSPIVSPTSVLGLHNMTSPTLSPPSISAPRPPIVTSPTSNTITQVSHSNSTSGAETTTPSIVTPTSAYFSTVSDLSAGSSPLTTTAEHPPALPSPVLPPYPVASPQDIISSPSSAPTSLSLPPSPIQVAKKRLSFMSYSDLLSSTPASTQSLSSLTTCASSTEPPPHLPSVIANSVQFQSHSIHGSPFAAASGHGGLTKRDSIAMLDNVGGEWEREGLGRGLEERLEALVIPEAMMASPVIYPVVWFQFFSSFFFYICLFVFNERVFIFPFKTMLALSCSSDLYYVVPLSLAVHWNPLFFLPSFSPVFPHSRNYAMPLTHRETSFFLYFLY